MMPMSSTETSVKSVAAGDAWARVVPKGRHLRIRSRRIVRLVAFNNLNIRERLDDSRTKGNAACLFVTVGSRLVSKFNRDLMQIVADNSPPWSHDFLTGMKAEIDAQASERDTDWSRLARALSPFGIEAHDIPTTLNFFSRVTVDGETGRLILRTGNLDYLGEVELRAETDCVVGISVSSQSSGPLEGAEMSLFDTDALITESSTL
jgi:uncharacterized protein YcgI (DUF1989 family)